MQLGQNRRPYSQAAPTFHIAATGMRNNGARRNPKVPKIAEGCSMTTKTLRSPMRAQLASEPARREWQAASAFERVEGASIPAANCRAPILLSSHPLWGNYDRTRARPAALGL